MKNIKEYINNINIDRLSKNEYFLNELKSIFGDNLSNSIIEQYNEYNVLDFSYIFENLKTHDSKKLQDKLLKEFSDIIKGFEIYKNNKDKQSFFILYKDQKYNEYLKLQENNKFNNILQFYNYYVTNKYYPNDNYEKCFLIEPRYSKSVKDELESNHIPLYHFTDCKSAESILKNGLRCKSSIYREFPERIFLWATKEKLFDDDKNLYKNIWEKIKNIIDKHKVNKYGLSILKINLYNRLASNIDIYSDTAMIDDEAVFIYNNVPSEYIKELIQIKNLSY